MVYFGPVSECSTVAVIEQPLALVKGCQA
jgi:hypothetical protein